MNAQIAKGMKSLWVEGGTHKKMKALAAINELTVQDLANIALAEYVKNNGGEGYVASIR